MPALLPKRLTTAGTPLIGHVGPCSMLPGAVAVMPSPRMIYRVRGSAPLPFGLPPTGQTTSYRAGDDGDVQAGADSGALPVTGQTTSYRAGDDGDIQAGIQE